MIFVTVGTHEQPFNRLIEYVDKLKGEGVIQEEVIMQIGFSTYEPINCKWQKLFTYSEMQDLVNEARIVITHGGPSSFIMPLQVGKIPIVVPRRKEFGEHVNNHQVEFVQNVWERFGRIIVIEQIDNLAEMLYTYNQVMVKKNSGIKTNNAVFCEMFEKIIDEIMK